MYVKQCCQHSCLGARRFCSKRRPFGSLPVKMKFFRVSNNAKLQNSFKCPLTAYECATDVFLNQYFHLRKNNLGILLLLLILLQGLSDSQAQLFSFFNEAHLCSPAQTCLHARLWAQN